MVMFVKQCLSNLLVQSDALCIHLQDNFGFVSSYMSFFGEKSILLRNGIKFWTYMFHHLKIQAPTTQWENRLVVAYTGNPTLAGSSGLVTLRLNHIAFV